MIAGDTNVCCDGDQLDRMEKKMQLAEGVLRRCTSCVKNLFYHICEFTCSENQTEFVEPVEIITTVTNPQAKGNFILFYMFLVNENFTNPTHKV